MSRFVLTAAIQLQAPTNTGAVVNQIRSQLRGANVNIQAKVPTQKLAQTNKQIQQITASTKMAQRSMGSLGATIGAAARRFAAITVATGTFLALARGIGEGFKAALQFEVEMLKLSQVTGKTVGDLKSLADQVTNVSITLGVASSEILGAARVLAQAGFSAEKTAGALKILAQTELAATFESIAQTTEGAVAILRQFRKEVAAAGGEVAYLQQALGAINAVSKAFAVESSDLIAVVRRTGGVFEAAGGKLNELIALFTSVRGTTRETAETIATGFRTIFTRIQRTETIDQLKQLGIVLQDAKGQFVGPLEAIKRLSAGLQALDPRDYRFNEIVEQLGGFRQIGKVIPLIKQYQTSIEALAVAQGGGASLAKDAEIAQQSLANQFAQVREKFLAMIRTFADSSTFRSMAKMAIQLAEAFIKVAEAIEPILPMLTALMAVKIGTMAAPAMGRMAGFGGRASGGRIQGFSSGGYVPGRGNRDSVPAMLQPGEFVIKKSSAKALGPETLSQMNGYVGGGRVTSRRHGYGLKPLPLNVAMSGGGGPRGPGVRTSLAAAGAPGDAIRGQTGKFSGVYTGKGGAGNTYRLIDLLDQTAMTALNSQNRLYAGAFLRPHGVKNDIGGKLGSEALAHIQSEISADPKAQAVRALLNSKSGGAGGDRLRTAFESEMGRIESAAKQEDYGLKIGSLPQAQAEMLEEEILNGVIQGVSRAGQKVFKKDLKIHKDPEIGAILKQANIDNVIGNMFEMVLTTAGGHEPWAADQIRANSNADFDYPTGLGTGGAGDLAARFGLPPNVPTDAKSTFNQGNVASFTKKIQNFEGQRSVRQIDAMVTPLLEQIFTAANAELGDRNALFPGASGKGAAFARTTTRGLMGIPKFASGGMVDSVPAMLTPGEFVVKKSSAGKIGYANLESMNQTGVAHFAAGGRVTTGRGRYGDIPAAGGIARGLPNVAAIQSAGEAARGAFTAVAKTGSMLNTAMIELTGSIGIAGMEVAQVGRFFISLSEGIKRTVGFLEAVSTNMQTAAMTAEGFASMFEPVVKAINNLAEQMIAAGAGISSIDDMIKEQVLAAGKAFTQGLVNAAAGISSIDDMMQKSLLAAVTPFGNAMTAMGSEMGKMDDMLAAQLKEAAAPLKAGLENAAASMQQIDDIIRVQLEAAIQPFKAAMQGTAGGVGAAVTSIQTAFASLTEFPASVSTLQGQMSQFGESLASISGALNEAAAKLTQLAGATTEVAASEGQLATTTSTTSMDLNEWVAQLEAAQAEQAKLTSSTSNLSGAADQEAKELREAMRAADRMEKALLQAENAAMHARSKLAALGASGGKKSMGAMFTTQEAGIQQTGALGMQGRGPVQAASVKGFMSTGQAGVDAFAKANQHAAAEMQNWTGTLSRNQAAIIAYEKAIGAGMTQEQALGKAKQAAARTQMNEMKAMADNPAIDKQKDAATKHFAKSLWAASKRLMASAASGTLLTGGGGKGAVAPAAGGGGGMAGGNMMMAAMMAPMITQMAGWEGAAADATTQFLMLAGIMPMVIASLVDMAAGMFKNVVAVALGTAAERKKALAMSGADKATMGLSLLAVAIMAVVAIMNYFKGKAKEAGEAASEMIKGIKTGEAAGGAAGVANVSAKRLEAVRMESKAAGAWSGGMMGVGGGAAIGAAIGSIIPGIGTVIGAGIGALIGGLAASYAGANLAPALTDAQKAAVQLSTAQVWAATALNNYANAQKQAQQLQLKGSALLQHQNKAAGEFQTQSKKARDAMEEFKKLEQGGFEGMDSESMEKSIEEAKKGMRELSKAAFQVADDQRKAIKSQGDDMIKAGKSTREILSDPQIVEGLRKMGDAALVGFQAQLKSANYGMDKAFASMGMAEDADFSKLNERQQKEVLKRQEKIQQAHALKLRNDTVKAEQDRIAKQNKAAQDARKAQQIEIRAKQYLAEQARRTAQALAVFEGALTVIGIGLENMSANLAAATGKFQFVDRSKQTTDLMKSENPNLRTAGFQRAGAAIGPAGNKMAASISRSEHNLDKFEKILGQQGLSQFGASTVQSGGAAQTFDDLNVFMKKFGIDLSKASGPIKEKITKMLSDGLDPDEIAEIIEMFRGPIEAQKENLMKMVEAQGMFLAKYNEVTTQLIEAKKKEIEGTVKLLDIQEKGVDRLAKAQGRSRSHGEKEIARNKARQARLQGTGLVAGDAAGAGAKMTQWKAEMDANNKLLSQKKLTAQQEMNLIKRQKELEQGINQARESLEDLADQSDRAADIMGEIDKERSKREAVAGTVKEFTFGGDDQRKQLNTNMMALQRVLATGSLNSIPGELRSAVGSLLDKFEDVDITGTGMTGGQVSKQLQVQQMDQMIRMQSGGRQGITADQIKKIFMSTTKEDKLINELKELNKEEQKAQMLLNRQLRSNTESADKMVTALSKQVKSIDRLIAQMQARGQAPGRALGGVVHLSEGGGNFWAPKGTDTVPAMLTPGEFVMRKSAVDRVGVGTLNRINKGGAPISRSRGGPAYLAAGGLALSRNTWVGDADAGAAQVAAGGMIARGTWGMPRLSRLYAWLKGDKNDWGEGKEAQYSRELNKIIGNGPAIKGKLPRFTAFMDAIWDVAGGGVFGGSTFGKNVIPKPTKLKDPNDPTKGRVPRDHSDAMINNIKNNQALRRLANISPILNQVRNDILGQRVSKPTLNHTFWQKPLRLIEGGGQQKGMAIGLGKSGYGDDAPFFPASEMPQVARAYNEARRVLPKDAKQNYLSGMRIINGIWGIAPDKFTDMIGAVNPENKFKAGYALGAVVPRNTAHKTTGMAGSFVAGRKTLGQGLGMAKNKAANLPGGARNEESILLGLFAPKVFTHWKALQNVLNDPAARGDNWLSFRDMATDGDFANFRSVQRIMQHFGHGWPPMAQWMAQGFARGGPVVDVGWWKNKGGDQIAPASKVHDWVLAQTGGNETLLGDNSRAYREGWLGRNPQGLGIWQQLSTDTGENLNNKSWYRAKGNPGEDLMISDVGKRDGIIYAMGVDQGLDTKRQKIGDNFTGVVPRFGVSGPHKFTDDIPPLQPGNDAGNTSLEAIMGRKTAALWKRYANTAGPPSGLKNSRGQDIPMKLPGFDGLVGRLPDGRMTFSANTMKRNATGLMRLIQTGQWNPFQAPNFWVNQRVMAGWGKGIPQDAMELANKRFPVDPRLGARNMDGRQFAVSYFAKGGGPKGTDTVPAMLTPGEFVMSKKAVQTHGMAAMKSLNKGKAPQHLAKGGPIYRQYGGDGGGGSWMDSFAMAIPALDNAAASMDLLSTAMDNFVDSMSAGWQMWHNVTLGGAITIHGFDSESVRLAIEDSIGAYIGDYVQKAIEGVVGNLWKKLG